MTGKDNAMTKKDHRLTNSLSFKALGEIVMPTLCVYRSRCRSAFGRLSGLRFKAPKRDKCEPNYENGQKCWEIASQGVV